MPGRQIGESTIRGYVRERKMELRLIGQEVFIPQSYGWGKEAQVDWYEAYADIGEERQKAYVFCMRSMASGGAFHCALPHASQQAFLEAHERAFAYFGGVFKILRYDNLRSAVKRILRGHQREETTRFIAFRSHWGFESEFCTPAEGHEKGGVEGEGGYFRRNHMVPVPQVASWEALNLFLLEVPSQNLLYRTLKVVVPQDCKYSTEIEKRAFVRFQKRLLAGVREGAMEGSSTGHAAHAKDVGQLPLSADICVSFIPIHLRLLTPN